MFKLLFMEQSYKHIKVCALTFYLELNLCHLKPQSTPRIQASHKDIAYFKIYFSSHPSTKYSFGVFGHLDIICRLQLAKNLDHTH